MVGKQGQRGVSSALGTRSPASKGSPLCLQGGRASVAVMLLWNRKTSHSVAKILSTIFHWSFLSLSLLISPLLAVQSPRSGLMDNFTVGFRSPQSVAVWQESGHNCKHQLCLHRYQTRSTWFANELGGKSMSLQTWPQEQTQLCATKSGKKMSVSVTYSWGLHSLSYTPGDSPTEGFLPVLSECCRKFVDRKSCHPSQ